MDFRLSEGHKLLQQKAYDFAVKEGIAPLARECGAYSSGVRENHKENHLCALCGSSVASGESFTRT